MNLFFFFCFLESGIWNVLLLSTDAMGVKLRFYIASCDFVDRSASLEYKSPKLSLLETRVSSRMYGPCPEHQRTCQHRELDVRQNREFKHMMSSKVSSFSSLKHRRRGGGASISKLLLKIPFPKPVVLHTLC